MTGRERLAAAERQVHILQIEIAQLQTAGTASQKEKDLRIQNNLLQKELKVLRQELSNSGGELLAQREEELEKLQVKYSTMQEAQQKEIMLLKGEIDIKNQELADMNFQLEQGMGLQQEMQIENEKLASKYYLLQK